jgi:hypothetical protein
VRLIEADATSGPGTTRLSYVAYTDDVRSSERSVSNALSDLGNSFELCLEETDTLLLSAHGWRDVRTPKPGGGFNFKDGEYDPDWEPMLVGLTTAYTRAENFGDGLKRSYTSQDLKVAWEVSILSENGDHSCGQAPRENKLYAIALKTVGGTDTMHVSFYDPRAGALKYAYFELHQGGSWLKIQEDTIDASQNIARYSSIAVDSENVPHVAYTTGGIQKYAKRDGPPTVSTVWNRDTVHTSGTVGNVNFIAVDSRDMPHISFTAGGVLQYARKLGATWNRDTVDPDVVGVTYSSIAVGANRIPQISYTAGGVLKYANKLGLPEENTGWNRDTVHDSGKVGKVSSIAVDSSGVPHISFSEGGVLKYARKVGTTWNRDTVDANPGIDVRFNSIAVDSSGRPHIAYDDSATGTLKSSRLEGSWNRDTVTPGTRSGAIYSSIAMNMSGTPRIGYYTGAILRFVRKVGTTWNNDTVANPLQTVSLP